MDQTTHTHTLPHTPTHTHTCIKGDFRFIQVASFSSVGVLRPAWGK